MAKTATEGKLFVGLFKNQNRNPGPLFAIQNELGVLQLVPECHSEQTLQFLLLMFRHMGKQLLLGGLRNIAGFAEYRHAFNRDPHELLTPVYRIGYLADQAGFDHLGNQPGKRVRREFQLGSNSGLTVAGVLVFDGPEDSILYQADTKVRQGTSDGTDELIVAESQEVSDAIAGGRGKALTKRLHLIFYQLPWIQSSKTFIQSSQLGTIA